MRLIAHRGFWIEPEERNTLSAFKRALQHGYGIETDLRDAHGGLVVSHDPPATGALSAREFFALCLDHPVAVPHALNIKSDGLHALLDAEMKGWTGERYFLFDMSVPDSLGYLRKGVPTFVRSSEYEVPAAQLLALAKGVWLDAFEGVWYGRALIENLFSQGKEVCIVSPELHRRAHLDHWESLKRWGVHRHPDALLCTDFPSEAEEYFHE